MDFQEPLASISNVAGLLDTKYNFVDLFGSVSEVWELLNTLSHGISGTHMTEISGNQALDVPYTLFRFEGVSPGLCQPDFGAK